MFNALPIEVQAYLASLVIGISAPLLFYWFLHRPLAHFLHDIFQKPEIEQFWQRLVLLVFLGSGLSGSVGFRPDQAIVDDYVALVWNFGEQVKQILDQLLWNGIGLIFLPLLLAYIVLHAGRRGGSRDAQPSGEA